MTKEEAIQVLNMVEAHGLADEAKRMAIESLSADEEEKNGTFVNRDNCNFNCNDSNRTLVEVVRCKDCRHYEDGMVGYCWETERGVSADFFCAYGERREP